MTTITIKVSDPKYAALLGTLLRSMDFVSDVALTENDNYQLTEAEMLLLKERRATYHHNPEKTRDWDKVQAELKQKYGL